MAVVTPIYVSQLGEAQSRMSPESPLTVSNSGYNRYDHPRRSRLVAATQSRRRAPRRPRPRPAPLPSDRTASERRARCASRYTSGE